MLGNKKIRNPFPKIGLVFKYEFLSGTRTFIPVYIATMILCLISGVFFTDTLSSITSDRVLVIMGIICALMSFAAFIITIVFIEKRFKKGMLENEAYLNLSLPVTMTEHVFGRLLAYFIWGCIYIVVSSISGLFILCSEWSNIFKIGKLSSVAESFYTSCGMHLSVFILMFAFYVISVILLVVMFIFFVNTVASLIKKYRLLLEIAVIIVFFVVLGNIIGSAMESLQNIPDFTAAIIAIRRLIIINISTVILTVIGTISILKFRLNLEA